MITLYNEGGLIVANVETNIITKVLTMKQVHGFNPLFTILIPIVGGE